MCIHTPIPTMSIIRVCLSLSKNKKYIKRNRKENKKGNKKENRKRNNKKKIRYICLSLSDAPCLQPAGQREVEEPRLSSYYTNIIYYTNKY